MQKTILYAVLNWGLGHATRSVPLIQTLINNNNKVIIVSDGVALEFLKKEFPKHIFEECISYNVSYSDTAKKFNWQLAKQIPKFINVIQEEHKQCQALCNKYHISHVISDNRYGFYSAGLPSALMCHQLRLLYPENKLIEGIVNRSYRNYLDKFTHLFVPDLPPPTSISGKMSVLKDSRVQYIGISSRLEPMKLPNKYQVLAILSGPEPQRSILEKALLKKLKKRKGYHLVVRGSSDKQKFKAAPNVELKDLLDSKDLNAAICASNTVFCRSGYTSVVDLLKLQKEAILLPTPGQVEQEYLANNLQEKSWFHVTDQESLCLEFEEDLIKPTLSFGYDFGIIQKFLSC